MISEQHLSDDLPKGGKIYLDIGTDGYFYLIAYSGTNEIASSYGPAALKLIKETYIDIPDRQKYYDAILDYINERKNKNVSYSSK